MGTRNNDHRLPCLLCDRKFRTREALRNHARDTHEGWRESLVELAEDIFGDMPDGAFFAAAGDLGLDPEDFLDDR